MKTQTVTSSPPRLLPPSLLGKQLLLVEHSTTTITTVPELTPEQITLRANTVTFVLQEMLQVHGYRHGGLND